MFRLCCLPIHSNCPLKVHHCTWSVHNGYVEWFCVTLCRSSLCAAYDSQSSLDTLTFEKLRVPIDLYRNEWAHFVFILHFVFYFSLNLSFINYVSFCHLYSGALLAEFSCCRWLILSHIHFISFGAHIILCKKPKTCYLKKTNTYS